LGDGEATYSRISIEDGSDVDKEAPHAAKKLLDAMALRERYAALNPRQLKWTYDGTNAFSIENLPTATQVRYKPDIFGDNGKTCNALAQDLIFFRSSLRI
jgi:hypothetical protein